MTCWFASPCVSWSWGTGGENTAPLPTPPPPRQPRAGRIQVSGRSATPGALSRAEGRSATGVGRVSAQSGDGAPGSRPPGQHPSPQRRLLAGPERLLPHGSSVLSGPASPAPAAWSRQPRVPRCGASDCGGDGGCDCEDGARRKQRWRRHPSLRHLGNQPTPRPSRLKPGRSGGAGAALEEPIGGASGRPRRLPRPQGATWWHEGTVKCSLEPRTSRSRRLLTRGIARQSSQSRQMPLGRF